MASHSSGNACLGHRVCAIRIPAFGQDKSSPADILDSIKRKNRFPGYPIDVVDGIPIRKIPTAGKVGALKHLAPGSIFASHYDRMNPYQSPIRHTKITQVYICRLTLCYPICMTGLNPRYTTVRTIITRYLGYKKSVIVSYSGSE